MRKWMVRAAVMLGICVATLLVATPAMAIWDWCDVDPVLSVGGHTVSINASIQGDPQQIIGHVVFRISVPKGTQVSVISIEPNFKAKVEIHYYNTKNSAPGIPVDVSVDIKTKTTFDSQLVVSLDGLQIAQDMGTTKPGKSDLDCNFTIQ